MPPSNMKETGMEKNANVKKKEDDNTPVWAHIKTQDTEYWRASQPIITLVVGKQQQKFYVHKDVLTIDSPFFKKCLSCPMKEAATNVIEFPEDDVSGFEQFIIYLYKSEIPKAWVRSKEDVLACMHTWVLGDKFMMPALQNEAMLRIMAAWALAPIDPAFYAWAIERLHPYSALYRLTKDILVSTVGHDPRSYQSGGQHYEAFEGLQDRCTHPGNKLLVQSLPFFALRGPSPPLSYEDYMVPVGGARVGVRYAEVPSKKSVELFMP